MIQDIVCTGATKSDAMFMGTVALIYLSEYILPKVKVVKANSTIQLIIDLVVKLITMVGLKKE